jgi:restriction endonuclease S subunit
LFEDDIVKLGSGSTFSAITTRDVRNLKIPLPPLDEQRRITEEIERQFAIVDKAKKAAEEQLEVVEKLQARLTAPLFASEHFSDCVWVSLSDCTTKVGSGATPRGGQKSYRTSGIPLIRSQNVHFYSFSENGLAYISELQNEQLKNTVVQIGRASWRERV